MKYVSPEKSDDEEMKIPDKKPHHKPGNSNPNKLLAKR
jgi:hypothetical protein